MNRRILFAPMLLLAGGALSLPAHAVVSLTQTTVTFGTTTTNVSVLENDFLAAYIGRDTATGPGRVLQLIKKTGTGAGVNQASVPASGYFSYLDRVKGASPTASSVTLTDNPDGDDSDAKRSLQVSETIATPSFQITKVYRLRDGSKDLECQLRFTNTSGADWLDTANARNGAETVFYDTCNGASTAGRDISVKTANGLDVASATGYWWWGPSSLAGGTTDRPELTEGWMAMLDRASNVTNVFTWDLNTQKAHGIDSTPTTPGRPTSMVYFTSNRFMVEMLYPRIAADETLDYTQHFIVDDGIPSVSYAAAGVLLAGIAPKSPTAQQGGTVTANIYMNSAGTSAAAYDLKNIQLIDPSGSVVGTAPNALNVKVPAPVAADPTSGHVTVAKQFTLSNSAPAGNYTIKADLYAAGGATPLSTLYSRPLPVTEATVKVSLFFDGTANAYVLENEVMRAYIDTDGNVRQWFLKPEERNQVNLDYAMFLDHARPLGTLYSFGSFQPLMDPNATDNDSRKSIAFQNGTSTAGLLTKTFTLESMSRSLQADFSLMNAMVGGMGGEGYFSQVAAMPGGGGDANDQFSVRTTGGLLTPHKASTRYWFGAQPSSAGDGTAIAAAQPELSEPWMAVTDQAVTDALAISWDAAKQKQYSLTPSGGTAPVTMNAVYEAGGFGRHVLEAHFTNIPDSDTLAMRMYAMIDTGYKLVSYAEGMRVMAGAWTDAATVSQGAALAFHIAMTNTGTTGRTFDLKNIRLVKDSGETTPAGADRTGIALAAAARNTSDLSFTVPAAQPAGAYTVQADLYEGGAKVATLQSLAFSVEAGVPAPNGDVNGDGTVDAKDAELATKIAAGIVAVTDPAQVARGDLFPATGDKALTLEDAAAILRKVAGL